MSAPGASDPYPNSPYPTGAPGPGVPGPGGPPAKKVGIGGCLISVALVVLSGVAFVGILVWATLGLVDDLQKAPGVPIGETGTVTITSTGEQFIFLGNFESGGSIPLTDPDVTITDPQGADVTIRQPTSTSSGSSGSGEFRSLGEFTATTTGEYTITSESTSLGAPDPGTQIYASNIDAGSLGAKILIAFAVGGILFLAAVVLGIVWLVRRSNAKKAAGPAYR
jgi:hypothetical protein